MSASSPQPARARRVTLSLVLLAAGLGVLWWTAEWLDLEADDIRSGFANIGAWFLVILLLSLVRFVLRARAWVILTGLPLPLGPAVAATISGDALGNVTPLGPVASEPAKALYLRDRADPAHTLAALVAENFFYSVSVALYVILASAAMFVLFALPPQVELAGQISLVGMAMVLGGAVWLALRQPAVISRLLEALPVARLRALAGQVRQFEQRTYGATADARMGQVAICEIGFHLLSLAECWLTFWLLAGETSMAAALVFDGFNRVVNVVGRLVPLRIGVEEGGTAVLAGAIGLLPHDGFMLGIVRKVRMLVWAAVGLVLWVFRSGKAGS